MFGEVESSEQEDVKKASKKHKIAGKKGAKKTKKHGKKRHAKRKIAAKK